MLSKNKQEPDLPTDNQAKPNHYQKEKINNMAPDLYLPEDVTTEDYEKATSKFAAAGEHLSELGMIEWDTPGVSLKFPFTIIEEGNDKGKEGKISAGVSKKSLWKVRELETALGLEKGELVSTDKDGRLVIKEAVIMSCVGKKFLSVWEDQKDSRTPEEGGTGNTYSKPVSAKAA